MFTFATEFSNENPGELTSNRLLRDLYFLNNNNNFEIYAFQIYSVIQHFIDWAHWKKFYIAENMKCAKFGKFALRIQWGK